MNKDKNSSQALATGCAQTSANGNILVKLWQAFRRLMEVARNPSSLNLILLYIGIKLDSLALKKYPVAHVLPPSPFTPGNCSISKVLMQNADGRSACWYAARLLRAPSPLLGCSWHIGLTRLEGIVVWLCNLVACWRDVGSKTNDVRGEACKHKPTPAPLERPLNGNKPSRDCRHTRTVGRLSRETVLFPDATHAPEVSAGKHDSPEPWRFV
ncbi:hypothetical protein PoMZ_13028 [Pyricularia oryzae]|uniref:Uncharacterized protein n=1 Tax=Pyricularia oryzae TaxID=318829 RepID=A0A4P7NUF5_PYROR|nr:hypothetical protein PoMZ_13028 [Pyricularia oryzae]